MPGPAPGLPAGGEGGGPGEHGADALAPWDAPALRFPMAKPRGAWRWRLASSPFWRHWPLMAVGVILLLIGYALYGLLAGPQPARSQDQLVQGTGYGFRLPSSWQDYTQQLARRPYPGVPPDRAYVGPARDGVASNINVVVSPRAPGPTLNQLAARSRQAIQQDLGARAVGGLRPARVGDLPAVTYDFTYRSDGKQLRARQYILYRGNSAYTLTFTASQAAFDTDVAVLNRALETWTWS